MNVLRIKDWNSHFETAQSRKTKGPLSWVAVPTKHDGEGYRTLLRMENGLALYGAWVLIVAVAAKAKLRGYLIGDKGPLTAQSISLKTDAPAGLIEHALSVLTEGIGWIEAVEIDSIDTLVAESERDGIAVSHSTGQNGQDRTGQNITSSVPDPVDRGGQVEGRQSRPARKMNPNSVFLQVTPEVLKDTHALRKWFLWQSGTKSKVMDSTDPDNWLFCLACASVSLTKEAPHRYFATIFGGKQRDKIGDIHWARAAELAREFPIVSGAVCA